MPSIWDPRREEAPEWGAWASGEFGLGFRYLGSYHCLFSPTATQTHTKSLTLKRGGPTVHGVLRGAGSCHPILNTVVSASQAFVRTRWKPSWVWMESRGARPLYRSHSRSICVLRPDGCLCTDGEAGTRSLGDLAKAVWPL